ncbi:MAG: hypothetical protein DWP92_07970 [Armatimonadetes bacterium]|nr:MAG: hypothetical protein DWP92_07970 [Armatimonadota bacterium]
MNIDKRLQDAAAATNAELQHEPIPTPRRSSRPSGFASAFGVAALVVGMVATAVLITGEETSPATSLPPATQPTVTPSPSSIPPSTIAPPPTTTPTEYVAPYYQSWSLEYPSTWYRADSRFFPNHGGESTVFATFALDFDTEGDYCAHVPPNTFDDLGQTDAVISIQLGGTPGPERPSEGFNDTTFPVLPVEWIQFQCAVQSEVEAHVGSWMIDGHPVRLLVLFGDQVTDERRTETWQIVSSLRTEPVTPHPGRGTCIATRPPTPGLTPPERWPATPSIAPESLWYGTADLWTVLPVNGRYEERKSVWWSQNFTDAGIESFPDIDVTLRRTDRDASPIVGDGGTNASTAKDGLFMIANAPAQLTRGCWSITGTYKGATLNYVVDVP